MVVKFLKKVFLFMIPILIGFVGIELFLDQYPNSFNQKANYLNHNLDIEALFLGSSHTQNAINPEFIDIKTANVAYGNQDYNLDNAVFFKYAKDLEKLKYLFIEMDYHNLEDKNGSHYFRKPWYNRYYGIGFSDIPILNRISLYSTNPGFFNEYIIRTLNPFSYPYELNEQGFITNDDPGIFKSCAYDVEYLEETAKSRLSNRHSEVSMANFRFNKKKMNEIISYCNEHDIQIFIIKYPVYITYRENYVLEKLYRRNKYLDSLSSALPNLQILNFERDSTFGVTDFKNDDHLNSEGSKRLSLMINEVLHK